MSGGLDPRLLEVAGVIGAETMRQSPDRNRGSVMRPGRVQAVGVGSVSVIPDGIHATDTPIVAQNLTGSLLRSGDRVMLEYMGHTAFVVGFCDIEEPYIGFMYRRVATQTIPSGVVTTISFDTRDEDTDAFGAAGAGPWIIFTVPVGYGGRYKIDFRSTFASVIVARVFSVVVAGGQSWTDGNYGDNVQTVAYTPRLRAGQTIAAAAFQQSGVDVTTQCRIEISRSGARYNP